jgi:tRNA pseudouridine65 synthase
MESSLPGQDHRLGETMPGTTTTPQVTVLHRDEHFIAVDKPSGVVVHHGWGREGRSLVGLVRDLVDHAKIRGVHRLDRGTSGVIVFGLSLDATRRLAEDMQAGEWEKRYVALVRGVAPEAITVDYAIQRKKGGERVPARTHFRRLATAETTPRHTSLVEAILETGRLHQVRRHIRHIDHPVIGDANYGDNRLNRAIAAEYELGRLALHAVSLTLPHPVTGARMVLTAPPPPDLMEPLLRMGYEEAAIRALRE